jgi:hypothetical protein
VPLDDDAFDRPGLDALAVLPRVESATGRIGLVPTITHGEPFGVRAAVATLDRVSGAGPTGGSTSRPPTTDCGAFLDVRIDPSVQQGERAPALGKGGGEREVWGGHGPCPLRPGRLPGQE